MSPFVQSRSVQFDALLHDDVVVMGDLILLEVLQGIRSDRACRTTREHLQALDQYELLGPGQVDVCAGHYRALRKRSITIRKTADVIIASFCITHNIPLLKAGDDDIRRLADREYRKSTRLNYSQVA